MKEVRVFLASSNELEHERTFLGSVVAYLTRYLYDIGSNVRLRLEKWEFLDASMGMLQKQEEYNTVLESCDAAVVLFWRKLGQYTLRELELARKKFSSGVHSSRLAIYFKTAGADDSYGIEGFKSKFPLITDGEIRQEFSSDDELKASFLRLAFSLLHDVNATIRYPEQTVMSQYMLA